MNELRRVVVVDCDLERAFQVFVGEVDFWWPPSHRKVNSSTLQFEARVGGRFFERTESGDEVELGTVMRWEPPRRLTYTWWPGANDAPTLVDVHFTEQASSTRVEVVHSVGESGLGDQWPARAKRFEAAWAEVLPAFAGRINGEVS